MIFYTQIVKIQNDETGIHCNQASLCIKDRLKTKLTVRTTNYRSTGAPAPIGARLNVGRRHGFFIANFGLLILNKSIIL